MTARPHAFVAMPFGVKPGPRGGDGKLLDPDLETIDFNRIYQDLIAPALNLAGLEPFRADQEKSAGDIIPDMFQELLVADLVVADLTIDNPNVIYRLTEWAANPKALQEDQIEHLQHGLEDNPTNLELLREAGMCLQRLALANQPGFTLDRARQHYRNALRTYPGNPEIWELLGRVDKDAWTATWRRDGGTLEQMRDDAADEDALLRGAIENYTSAFRTNPGHYYSGINCIGAP